MKKNRMTLQEHRLLREASQLLTFAEKMKTAKPKITKSIAAPRQRDFASDPKCKGIPDNPL